MDDILQEFLEETIESLNSLEPLLGELETSSINNELVRQIFRVFHTIKGTCGFLGLGRLESLAHSSEEILSKISDKSLEVSESTIRLIFLAIDRMKLIVEQTSAGKVDNNENEDADIIEALGKIIKKNIQTVEVFESSAEPNAFHLDGNINYEESKPPKTKINQNDQNQSTKEQYETLEPPQFDNQENPSPSIESNPIPSTGSSLGQQFIRVGINVLDDLLNLVGELVLTRNQLIQMLGGNQTSQPINNAISRLNYITSELQEEIVKTRMQPIEQAWIKFPRLVRELSRELDKQINLDQKGGDAELDRQVIELIQAPLTHMIRNAADHGIESSHKRISLGKPANGTISLNAYHEANQIIIEVKDDGKGIDVERIRNKILDRGLATQEDLNKMSDCQTLSYIFTPGFSTAESITNVSGRGVGMDVVRANIEKLGGTVDLKSKLNQGTEFKIRIPLTLSIISCLIVGCANHKFAIPQISVSELLRVSPRSRHKIEFINQVPVLRLRNGLLPLVFLNETLELEDTCLKEECCIILTQIGNIAYGIVVDQVFDIQEIVVKPLNRIVQNVKFFSGSTILGDGSIVMILDPSSISNALNQIGNKDLALSASLEVKSSHEKALLLLFRVGVNFYAVPMGIVSRIVEMSWEELERINGQYMVKYQGHLLPIAALEYGEDILRDSESKASTFPILIFSDRGLTMGIAIDEVISIIEQKLDLEIQNRVDGILGSCIIDNRTTCILDTEYYLKKINPNWFEYDNTKVSENQRKLRLLMVDDSQFYRNLIIPVLSLSGYAVHTAIDGLEAYEMCLNEPEFDVIVSDIQMPGMTGLELVEKLRALESYKNKLIISLSAKPTELTILASKKAGFDEHFSKSNQRVLRDLLEGHRLRMLNTENLHA
jgi:two-component system chemotaxis sensor kinase CheA